MSGPYVSFRVNRQSRAILTDTVRFEIDPAPDFTNPFEWLIVCDSGDRVVIRSLEEGKRSLAVIAVAQLRGMTLVERKQIDGALPSAQLWTWLEDVVYPMRARGYEGKHADAFDNAALAQPAASPDDGMSPEQVWQMAAGQISSAAAAIPKPPSAPPPPRARRSTQPQWQPPRAPQPPDTPLWTAPQPDRFVPGAPRYLELLFDHANVAVVGGTVRYTPDHSIRPNGDYQQKLICQPDGTVTIWGPGELDLEQLATATWKDSGLANRQQAGRAPDDFQWIALEDALRAELGRAP